jgi:hypothetical protein
MKTQYAVVGLLAASAWFMAAVGCGSSDTVGSKSGSDSLTSQYGDLTARSTRAGDGAIRATLASRDADVLVQLAIPADANAGTLLVGAQAPLRLAMGDASLFEINDAIFALWEQYRHAASTDSAPSKQVLDEDSPDPPPPVGECRVIYGGNCAMTCDCFSNGTTCISCCKQSDGSVYCASF